MADQRRLEGAANAAHSFALVEMFLYQHPAGVRSPPDPNPQDKGDAAQREQGCASSRAFSVDGWHEIALSGNGFRSAPFLGGSVRAQPGSDPLCTTTPR